MKNVLLFSAQWCGPCKAFGPQFAAVMDQHKDVTYTKIDVDEGSDLVSKYGVRGVPTVVVLDNDKEVARISGAQVNKTNLEKLI